MDPSLNTMTTLQSSSCPTRRRKIPRRPYLSIGCLVSLLLLSSLPSSLAVEPPKQNTSILKTAADEMNKAKTAIRNTLSDMTRSSTIRNVMRPTVSKLFISRQEAAVLWKTIRSTAKWQDLAIILLIGWCSVPAVRIPYGYLYEDEPPFPQTYYYLLADHMQQLAKIAGAIYIVDILQMLLIGMGFEWCKMENIPHAFAQSCYTVWLASRMVAIKKHFVRNYVSHHPETFGRMQLLARLADATIYGIALFFVLSILQVQMGVAMHSILAFGSVGTLAVGLASQGIISQLLNGLMLASSDRIYQGDKIQLSSGLSGTIVKLGWLETIIRGSDEITTSLPNTELMKHQIRNLSRIRYCQVKQTLLLPNKESVKVPAFLQSIKDEIQLACPEVVTDGTRPFRAHWTDYKPNGDLELTIDAHFANIKPIGDTYWENRQRVLQAIQRAVRINQVEFK